MKVSTNFTGYRPLSTTRDDRTGLRILNRNYTIRVGDSLILVPKGFDTDFSSYPWAARLIVRFDRVDVAGVVHDYLYRTQKMSRRDADRIWRLVAMHGHTRATTRQGWVSWAGLRLGGWVVWNKLKKRIKTSVSEKGLH